MLEQMQMQLSQMRRTMTEQKAFKAELQQFFQNSKKNDDSDNSDEDDENNDDENNDDKDGDDDKNKKDPEEKGKTRMAGLLAKAAAQSLRKERK